MVKMMCYILGMKKKQQDCNPKSPNKTKAWAFIFSLLPVLNLLFLFIVTVVTFFHVYDKLD